MSQPNRIFFLDNLRAFNIMLVVLLHGAMTYMAYAPQWWYVVDSQNSLFFTLLVLLVDIPIMQIMFFVAGYFALPSLRKRGIQTFLKNKFIRVGAPWIFGALFLAPPTAYIMYFSRQLPVSLVEFWIGDFWGAAYQQSVYWFLGVLFFFFIVLSLIYNLNPRLRDATPQLSNPSWKLFVMFWAIMTLMMLFIHQFFEAETWFTQLYILVIQPLRVPLYIGYFWLGLYAYQRGWFRADGYMPRLWPWSALWLVSGLLYLAYRIIIAPTFSGPPIINQGIYVVLFNSFCLSSLMGGSAFFQAKVNGDGPIWKSMSANSYGIYYIHPLILYPLAFLFLDISLPLFVKAPLVILLGFVLSWAVTALILKKLPGLQRVF
ncbi:acyltransferase [Anaerolineales bacterium HSG24]|nr:acyltransferase [Anaerolineales bacterium HSG24]